MKIFNDWYGGLNEDAKLKASDAAALDRFGRSVSISGDTNSWCIFG